MIPRSQPVPTERAYSVPEPADARSAIFIPFKLPEPIAVELTRIPLLVILLAAPEVRVLTSTPFHLQSPPEQPVTVGAEIWIGTISFVPVDPVVLIVEETFNPLTSELPEVLDDVSVRLIFARFPF